MCIGSLPYFARLVLCVSIYRSSLSRNEEAVLADAPQCTYQDYCSLTQITPGMTAFMTIVKVFEMH